MIAVTVAVISGIGSRESEKKELMGKSYLTSLLILVLYMQTLA